MGIEFWAGLAAIGSFVLGVGIAYSAVRRRGRAELEGVLQQAKAYADREIREHADAEHTRDSEGRTLRERIGNLEVRCRERHGG